MASALVSRKKQARGELKPCSQYIVGISTADLRYACGCHWMQPVYPLEVYLESVK